jgi:polyisoprenoid-binding protein YceI
MKACIKGFAITLVILLFCSHGHAAAPAWELDPAHAGIYFSVDHIYSTTRGYFEKFTAAIHFSPDDLAGSRFEFDVQVKSIHTGNSKRDGHLMSADFFDAKKYPAMTFKSTAVRHVKDNQYEVDGQMTVKDVSQSVSVPFTLLGVKPHPFDAKSEVAGFEARMTIDRLAYHVGGGKFYDMGVVGKDVEVLITLEATRKK